MTLPTDPIPGRGSPANAGNRFERLRILPDPDAQAFEDDESPLPRTVFLKDTSRTVIAHNDSPDVGFEASLNPYRGCEHGCIYCYARPTHEYLGFSPGLDFESKIMVKADAPELLRQELSSPKWQPKVVSIGGVTDPYQPIERRLRITRRCLEVFAEFGNPIGIVTKNHLVTRDIDILSTMAKENLAIVFVSVTTLDANLTRIMEPRTSVPKRRLAAIEALSKAGIPAGVMVAPVIPGLTDHEMPAILRAAADAGARVAGYTPLRLPYSVKDLFEAWLDQHMPDRKEKILNRIRSIRGGKLNNSDFGLRMRGQGIFADQMRAMFKLSCRKVGINADVPHLSTNNFHRPAGPQLLLFE
jgi:DNA repair photolyase